MMNHFYSIVVLFLTLFVLSGCSEEKVDSITKDYVIQEATQVATDYIQENQKKEAIITSYKFKQDGEKSLILVKGYDKEAPDQKIELIIDYNQDFTVIE